MRENLFFCGVLGVIGNPCSALAFKPAIIHDFIFGVKNCPILSGTEGTSGTVNFTANVADAVVRVDANKVEHPLKIYHSLVERV